MIVTHTVTSSNVATLAYDPDTMEVTAVFKKKTGEITGAWVYWPVEELDFDAVLHAASVGAAVNEYLVAGARAGTYHSKKA